MKPGRLTPEIAKNAITNLSGQIGQRQAFGIECAKFIKHEAEACTRRQRIVLLNLGRSAEAAFWQVVHNTPERFAVISEKESHQKQEYVVRLIFYELGDELPVVKTKEELLIEYVNEESSATPPDFVG